jgi:N-acylneuraminate cytidylyltransferase
MKVLGIITARGGSKGLPGKNIKPLGGKPLIQYSIEAANDTPLERLILSTEDPKIAAVARVLGCDVPFMRPADDHEGYRAEAVVILQPTSPLRSSADIAAALRMLELSGADSVVSVSEVSAHAHPMRMLRVDDGGLATLFVTGEPVRNRINRRQDLPRAFVMNGAVYACRTEVLFGAEPSLYGDRVVAYPMPVERSISIDVAEDWEAAEHALANQPRDHHHHST